MAIKTRPTTLLFLLAPFFSIPLILQDIYYKKNNSFILFSCLMGILAYLYLPSEIQDGAKRYYLYEELRSFSLDDFIDGFLFYRTDLIYYVLIYIFTTLGIKFQILLFILAFFNTYVPLFIFKKIMDARNISSKKYFNLFILVVLTYSLTFLFSGVRNNVAFSFVILGFYYLFFENKKYRPYILLTLGVLTHFSMIIYLPVFIFSRKLNIKLLTAIFLLITIVSFVLPTDMVQDFFQNIDLGSETYDEKVQSYSDITEIGNDKTTMATLIAKLLFWVWFYVSLLYVYINLNKKRDKRYLITYFLFAIPVLLFIAFPGISIRYLFGLKFFFVLLLINDSFHWDNRMWRNLFLGLLAIQPLYDITRLMTQSFIAGYFRLENMTLVQILMQTYTFKDMLPPY